MAAIRRGELILVAPNAFKGSLSGPAAASAMARGVRRARPGARVLELPIADGGDGLIDSLRAAEGGSLAVCSVHGPLGERRRSSYLWLPKSGTAIIEMARASGLALVPPARRRPLAASTRGVGELMRDAVRRGARLLIVGLGGSASSDGGAGMARALGARLLDAKGRELPDGAEALLRLERVEAGAARALLAGVRVLALSDVDNPLLGPNGSARVFGPQKGATPAQVRALEAALANYARVIAADLRVRVGGAKGGGAAGGLGAGLLAFAGASIMPGADWVLDRLGLADALKGVGLVLTGEGRLDRTSLRGKAPVALARRARVPCVAVAAQAEPGLRGPFARVVTFADAGARGVADSMRRAAHWAARAAALAAAALLLAALPADAGNWAEIDRLYWQRHQGDHLARYLQALEGGDEDAQRLWRRCRGLVRLGERKKAGAERLADYAAARADCGKAAAAAPSSPEARFWNGVAMGRWGQAKGIMKSLFLVKPIKREMEATLKLDPAHGGAHHVLGEILWQLPGFAGGDKRRALAEFEEAVRLSPDYTANYVPLAEAYLHFERRDDAIRTLKAVLEVKEPADPAEHPDNIADARALLSRLEDR